MLPGYEGFIPRINEGLGERYAIQAEKALSKFELQQQEVAEAANQLEMEVAQNVVRSNKWEPDIHDKMIVKTAFKLPLHEVRPEFSGTPKTIPVSEIKPDPTLSPYFMEVLDEDKKFITGYAGHVPYIYSKFGKGYSKTTNSALCEFTSDYRRKLENGDPPLTIQPAEIYPEHIGMLPNYAGFIPGAQFRQGKTFGTDTRDAKRWLRGDFS